MRQETLAWVCALGTLFAISVFLVSELPDIAEQGTDLQLLDGFWFAFIASTTIGLGDVVPPAREWHIFLLHFLFLVVGVTLVGLLISAAVRSYANLQGMIEEKIHLKEHEKNTDAGGDPIQESDRNAHASKDADATAAVFDGDGKATIGADEPRPLMETDIVPGLAKVLV